MLANLTGEKIVVAAYNGHLAYLQDCINGAASADFLCLNVDTLQMAEIEAACALLNIDESTLDESRMDQLNKLLYVATCEMADRDQIITINHSSRFSESDIGARLDIPTAQKRLVYQELMTKLVVPIQEILTHYGGVELGNT